VGSYCPEGTNNATACAAGYYTAGTGATAETDCVIISLAPPSSCPSHTATSNVDEIAVSGCTGGDINGAAVTNFVMGGYCSGTGGAGSYADPVAQTCTSCSPATSAAGANCYCKIHSINGISVVSSQHFVFRNTYGGAAVCQEACTSNCVSSFINNSKFRIALFSAIGEH
jgi:hypothetical protein